MTDMSNARYYAISGLGYGKGNSPEEALENYVRIQLRNYPAKSTVFGTKAKWEHALRKGEAKPILWHAPEGTTGFVLDSQVRWFDADNNYTTATEAQRIWSGMERLGHFVEDLRQHNSREDRNEVEYDLNLAEEALVDILAQLKKEAI